MNSRRARGMCAGLSREEAARLTRLALGRTGASNGTGWKQHAAKPLVEALYIQCLLRLTLCCRWQRALFDSFPARVRREGDRI